MTWQVLVRDEECAMSFDETIHTVPVGDILEHTGIDCECLPKLVLVRGPYGWGLCVQHQPLDGRHD